MYIVYFYINDHEKKKVFLIYGVSNHHCFNKTVRMMLYSVFHSGKSSYKDIGRHSQIFFIIQRPR